jgi:hypothetical protein
VQLVELAQWISAYYVCPIGMTLASMTPAAVKKGVGTVTRTLVDLAPGWEVAIAAAKRVTVQQRRAVEALRTAADVERPMDVRDLCERAELGTPEPVKRLVSAGILVAQRRTKALLGGAMQLPTRRDLDARLIGGSLLFGVGWGIAGICPGPAVAILLTGHWQALLFVAAMLAGMLIFTALEGWRGR